MSKRLDELRTVDPVLSNIIQAYEGNSLVYDHLFPNVRVKSMKGRIPYFGKDAFVIRDTLRAIRASSNRIAPDDFSLIDYETKEQDIETAIDYLEEHEAADFYKLEQRLAKNLKNILELGKEKAASELVLDESLYSASQKLEVPMEYAFDDLLGEKDPIELIKDCMFDLRQIISVYPNTMVIGDEAYRALCSHPKVLERIKYSGNLKITKNMLADILEIPDIQVGRSVHSTDGENFTDIWNDSIVLAFVDKSSGKTKSEYNPSFGYTLQLENMPEVDTYFEAGGKIKVIRNTDNYDLKVTSRDAAFLISNTVQS